MKHGQRLQCSTRVHVASELAALKNDYAGELCSRSNYTSSQDLKTPCPDGPKGKHVIGSIGVGLDIVNPDDEAKPVTMLFYIAKFSAAEYRGDHPVLPSRHQRLQRS